MNMIFTAWAAVSFLMFVLWLIHLPLKNASIVDAGWAAGIALCASIFTYLGQGNAQRRILLTAMICFWGLRLAVHLVFDRIIGQPEEGRYVELREKWKTNISLKFLGFYQLQALTCVMLATPFFLASQDNSPLGFTDWLGLAIWIAGLCGESIADAQLKRFKANAENRGLSCRAGLWNYSRHPNYFFEWLTWVGYATIAMPSEWGAVGLLAPAMILFLLLRVTGIPATEQHAVKSRRDYKEYQATTSAFVPWFKKA